MQEQAETEYQDNGIKMNLQKRYHDIKEEMKVFEGSISELQRALNKAIAYDNDEDIKLNKQKKQNKEKELKEYEQNVLGGHLEQFLKVFVETKNKWIIQCYHNKIDNFTKDKLTLIAQQLNLEIKDDSKILTIARKGKPLNQLIAQVIKEERQKIQNQQQAQQQQNNQNTNAVQSNGSSTTVEQPNGNSHQQQRSQNQQQQNNRNTNIQLSNNSIEQQNNDNSVQKQRTQNQPQNNQNTNTQSINGSSASVGSANNSHQQMQNRQNTSTQQQNGANKAGEKKKEENPNEEYIYKVYEESLKKKQQGSQVKEILQEFEEDQKNMTTKEIYESLCLAPESVMNYEVLSMSDDYILKIRAKAPESNGFQICCYKVYLIKKKNLNLNESLKEQALLEGVSINYMTELLIESKSNEIDIDLKSISTSNFIQTFNDELKYSLFSITACSKNEDEILESQIKNIFIINIPKIILEKTKLFMSGSCELISSKFFQNHESLFEQQYDKKLCAIRNFISLDNDLFQQIQIQQVNLGRSALILLKNGKVIQWGQVIYFFDNKDEYPADKIEQESANILVEEPFMPVNHPLVFTRIAQGESHYVGVTIDGQVYSWGLNIYGQLGHQNQVSYPEPKRIEFFINERIFIVDVKCGENFTVCKSIDGSLYTFGQQQALEGVEMKDLYNDVLNYCNQGIHQYAPRKVRLPSKVINYECGPSHCILLTDKSQCFLWGDNHYMQVCQDKNFSQFSNFASPIPVQMTCGEGYSFKKVFCNISHNSAILYKKDSKEQIYVKWGGDTTSLNVKICVQKMKQPQEKDDDVEYTKKTQKVEYLNNFDNFSTNLYSNLLVVNKNDSSTLYANGLNNTFELGVKNSKINDFEQVPLPNCKIVQVCLGETGTGALLVIQ